MTNISVPIVAYMNYWEKIFAFDRATRTALNSMADYCGFTQYLDRYLKFPPPPGPFPATRGSEPGCDARKESGMAASAANPCWNVYHITDYCPVKWDVLGHASLGFEPLDATIYFNRSDVQTAINVPPTNWRVCANRNVNPVFVGPDGEFLADQSEPPALNGVLQNVVESLNNSIISVGMLDWLLPANGTLLVLQNMTWNGVQGFQSPPSRSLLVQRQEVPRRKARSNPAAQVDNSLVEAGNFGSERGLTFATVNFAGHSQYFSPP
jgi:carboxypeptidase D